MKVDLYSGHILEVASRLPAGSIDLIPTSPPYFGLRDYGPATHAHWPAVTYTPMPGLPPITIPEWDGALGSEPDVAAFIGHLVAIFRALIPACKPTATIAVNLGDSYTGSGRGPVGKQGIAFAAQGVGDGRTSAVVGLPPQSLIGVPWRFAYAMQSEDVVLRSAPPWLKWHSGMPISTHTRINGNVENWFFFTLKPSGYYYDDLAVARPTTESTINRMQRGRSANHKNAHGAPGQPVHTMMAAMEKMQGDDVRPVDPTRGWRAVDITEDAMQEAAAEFRSMADYLDWVVNRLNDEAGGELLASSDGTALALCYPTQPSSLAHFATFGERMLTDIIQAASPAKCCQHCGAPWRRRVERAMTNMNPDRPQRGLPEASIGQRHGGGDALTQDLGFYPACKCEGNDGSLAGMVCDPFVGSGTTCIVADRLGRTSIGIDADAGNIAMTFDRIVGDAPLLAQVRVVT